MALLGNYFGTPSIKKTVLTGIQEAPARGKNTLCARFSIGW